jgi:hypothetical protein
LICEGSKAQIFRKNSFAGLNVFAPLRFHSGHALREQYQTPSAHYFGTHGEPPLAAKLAIILAKKRLAV